MSNVITTVEPSLFSRLTNFFSSVPDKAKALADKARADAEALVINDQDGGSRRRRRRCTKKHSHSSACKRKSKGRKSYRKRR